jgi:hypothetical protein
MNPANNRVFWETPVNPRPLEVGTMLKVELYQAVADLSGHYGELRPHVVGQAEVVKDGTLKLSLSTISAAGREAAALLEDGVVDVVLWGSQPVIRLTQACNRPAPFASSTSDFGWSRCSDLHHPAAPDPGC